MSQLSSTASQSGPQKTQHKQRINVYTIMLVVSFIAICLACLAMYFELERYGKYPWWDTNEANPSRSAPAAPAPTSSLRLLPGTKWPTSQFAWQRCETWPNQLEESTGSHCETSQSPWRLAT